MLTRTSGSEWRKPLELGSQTLSRTRNAGPRGIDPTGWVDQTMPLLEERNAPESEDAKNSPAAKLTAPSGVLTGESLFSQATPFVDQRIEAVREWCSCPTATKRPFPKAIEKRSLVVATPVGVQGTRGLVAVRIFKR